MGNGFVYRLPSAILSDDEFPTGSLDAPKEEKPAKDAASTATVAPKKGPIVSLESMVRSMLADPMFHWNAIALLFSIGSLAPFKAISARAESSCAKPCAARNEHILVARFRRGHLFLLGCPSRRRARPQCHYSFA